MTAPTITAFITAMLDADEAVALAAVGEAIFQKQTGAWVYEHVPHRPTGTTIPIIFAVADGGGKTQVANMEAAWEPDARADHIARHDPARVLRRIAADRAIVALACGSWDSQHADLTLRHLASVWSDDPGYRAEEWSP